MRKLTFFLSLCWMAYAEGTYHANGQSSLTLTAGQSQIELDTVWVECSRPPQVLRISNAEKVTGGTPAAVLSTAPKTKTAVVQSGSVKISGPVIISVSVDQAEEKSFAVKTTAKPGKSLIVTADGCKITVAWKE